MLDFFSELSSVLSSLTTLQLIKLSKEEFSSIIHNKPHTLSLTFSLSNFSICINDKKTLLSDVSTFNSIPSLPWLTENMLTIESSIHKSGSSNIKVSSFP